MTALGEGGGGTNAGPKVELRRIDGLREYANNARKITDRAVEYVARSIREFEFLYPLVVTAAGEIVCGHVPSRAARMAGLEEVPCVVADDLTEEQVKAFRLADNKTAAMAIWNTEKLAEEMKKLVGTQFTMEGMGFDERMLGEVAEGAAPEVKDTSGELDLEGDFGDGAFEHVCPHCGLKF